MKRLALTSTAAVLCFALFCSLSTPAHAQVDPTRWYQLVARHNGKCVDLQGATLANGQHLVQFTCHSGDNQKFQFQPLGNGYYRIVVGHSRKCVDQLNATFTDASQIGQYACHTGYNQQWQLIPDGTGYYQIRVRHSGKNMDAAINSVLIIQHTPHNGYNQLFSLQETGAPCADSDGDGFCTTYDCDDSDSGTYPGAPMFCEYGEDRDCNGQDDGYQCEFVPEW